MQDESLGFPALFLFLIDQLEYELVIDYARFIEGAILDETSWIGLALFGLPEK